MPQSRLQSESNPRFRSSESGVLPGVQRIVNVPNPGAGAEWSVSVPGGVSWRVLSIAANFNTSAVVATRRPRLIVTWQGVTLALIPNLQGIVASTLVTFTYLGGSYGAAVDTGAPSQLYGFPYVWYQQGVAIGSNTTSRDAGDVYSNVNLLVEECYVTDQLLTEQHLEHQAYREERAALDTASELRDLGYPIGYTEPAGR